MVLMYGPIYIMNINLINQYDPKTSLRANVKKIYQPIYILNIQNIVKKKKNYYHSKKNSSISIYFFHHMTITVYNVCMFLNKWTTHGRFVLVRGLVFKRKKFCRISSIRSLITFYFFIQKINLSFLSKISFISTIKSWYG